MRTASRTRRSGACSRRIRSITAVGKDWSGGRPSAMFPSVRAGAWLGIDLGGPIRFDVALTQEQISEGQHVEAYRIDALTGQGWKEVARGTTIGHKKLDRIPAVEASRVRLTIDRSRGTPLL